MKPPAIINAEFEGQPLLTLTWKGQPAWIASQVGRAMGYAQRASRLVTRITRDWADEFIYGHDYLILTGEELAALKELLGPSTESVGGRASQVALLLEPGLHLALTKTGKPVGRKLRRFLVDEVLPRIARGQELAPLAEPRVLIAPRATPMLAWDHPDPGILRERRLARQVDLADRKLRSTALREAGALLHRLGDIGDGERAICEVAAARIALGEPVLTAQESLPDGWMMASDLGEHLGVSDLLVMKVMLELRLQNVQPGLSGIMLVPSENHADLRPCTVLSPEAVAHLRRRLAERGDLPEDAA